MTNIISECFAVVEKYIGEQVKLHAVSVPLAEYEENKNRVREFFIAEIDAHLGLVGQEDIADYQALLGLALSGKSKALIASKTGMSIERVNLLWSKYGLQSFAPALTTKMQQAVKDIYVFDKYYKSLKIEEQLRPIFAQLGKSILETFSGEELKAMPLEKKLKAYKELAGVLGNITGELQPQTKVEITQINQVYQEIMNEIGDIELDQFKAVLIDSRNPTLSIQG